MTTELTLDKMKTIDTVVPRIPTVDDLYQPTEFYEPMKKILETKLLHPMYISGPSGNGKSLTVRQICAELGREFLFHQVSPTMEDHELFGNVEIVDGETVYRKGVLIAAMERGCVLILDEFDRSSTAIMKLQNVLQGEPYLLSGTGEYIYPKKGFNIVATGNTLGRGSDDGFFATAQVLDGALTQRFKTVFRHDYLPFDAELTLVKNRLDKHGISDDTIAQVLVKWADNSRNQSVVPVISTRKIEHVIDNMAIFGVDDDELCVQMATNIYDEEEAKPLRESYKQMKADVEKERQQALRRAQQKNVVDEMSDHVDEIVADVIGNT